MIFIVENLPLSLSANFKNRLTFGEVMGKSLVSCFLDSRCSSAIIHKNSSKELLKILCYGVGRALPMCPPFRFGYAIASTAPSLSPAAAELVSNLACG